MTIYEGTIITCDKRDAVCRFLVEEDGRILTTGDTDPAQLDIPHATQAKRVTLGNQALVPAFTDSHIHFSSWAFFLSTVDIRAAKSNAEIAAMLAEAASRAKNNKPLLAYGASAHSVKEGTLVNRVDLDAALRKQPVCVVKYDGHACICNSAMLDLLPADILQGRGSHEDTGELNQEAFFGAIKHVTNSISPVELLRRMLSGYDQLAMNGIGMIHSAEGVGFPKDIEVSSALFVARGLRSPFRTRLFFQTMDLERVLRRGLPRVGGCFATALDGSFGSEDAALREPYSHRPAYRGVLFYDQKTVNDFCVRANRAGLQIAMHAIGDAAFAQALTALQAALAETPRPDHRHIIIHGFLAEPAELETCARLGIGIAAQSALLAWPQEPASYLERALGSRIERLLPLKSMRELGLRISLGSDAPCSDPDPMLWLHTACNHPNPAQSVSVQDALNMMTREGAWMSFDDKETGSLETGKWADMVMLSVNPLSVPKAELKDIRVERLFMRGRPWNGAGSLPGLVMRSLLHRHA